MRNDGYFVIFFNQTDTQNTIDNWKLHIIWSMKKGFTEGAHAQVTHWHVPKPNNMICRKNYH